MLADFAVCDCRRYCKALCDVKFRLIQGNGRTFRQIELIISQFSNSAPKWAAKNIFCKIFSKRWNSCSFTSNTFNISFVSSSASHTCLPVTPAYLACLFFKSFLCSKVCTFYRFILPSDNMLFINCYFNVSQYDYLTFLSLFDYVLLGCPFLLVSLLIDLFIFYTSLSVCLSSFFCIAVSLCLSFYFYVPLVLFKWVFLSVSQWLYI